MTASGSTLFRPHDEAPAIAKLRPFGPPAKTDAWSGLSGQLVEYVSRGDFVSGLIHLPDSSHPEPAPLVFLLHGTGKAADSASFDFAADWVRQGFAVCRIDLPLHGLRASPKLSERLVAGLQRLASGELLDADSRALVEEFARQSTSDLLRGIEAFSDRPEIDADRVALVGRGAGGAACAWARPFATRLRGIALLGDVGTFADSELDPGRALYAPAGEGLDDGSNPSLLVIESAEGSTPPEATRALFETASEPKRLESASAPGGQLADALQSFLDETLRGA